MTKRVMTKRVMTKRDYSRVAATSAVAALASVLVTAAVTWAVAKARSKEQDQRLAECQRLAAEQDRLLAGARAWGWPGTSS